MDAELTSWINAAAGNPTLDSVMIAVTQFGVPLIVLIVALHWWARNGDRSHVRHAAVAAGLSFLLGLAINQLVLLFVHRARPYDAGLTHLLISPSGDWSFPSDHATASMAVAAAFAMQRLPRRSLVLFVLAIFVCLSRVYVGTHYVSDIVGGALTGIIAAMIVRFSYREGTKLDRFATSIL
ncbi:undecaprenyl-diphosphatase [Mesorhizobium soli]|uniref:phosphatase PAP2 family protein n=1 Tax=Pseudaminobacter soli (ex Li et al. 2025) TaxID=1295366 RepID=UPI002474CC37|nr:phosphatase PAP2 family protein [Mesorhizobium soli]MDH6232555.1 undecaprenyl-diphosphatase [Mesorhizobium soli]